MRYLKTCASSCYCAPMIWVLAPQGASLHAKRAAQTVRFQPGDRRIDVVGAEIGKAAAFQMLAHFGLRCRQPAAAPFQFEEADAAVTDARAREG